MVLETEAQADTTVDSVMAPAIKTNGVVIIAAVKEEDAKEIVDIVVACDSNHLN